uniref:Uncharacterized protein n=1 Tax=Cacopsylla melanoneura TaxID=428564 RepID=A0A8D8YLP7_9HEMI
MFFFNELNELVTMRGYRGGAVSAHACYLIIKNFNKHSPSIYRFSSLFHFETTSIKLDQDSELIFMFFFSRNSADSLSNATLQVLICLYSYSVRFISVNIFFTRCVTLQRLGGPNFFTPHSFCTSKFFSKNNFARKNRFLFVFLRSLVTSLRITSNMTQSEG